MGNRKRKEYKPGDKVSFRLTEEYQSVIDWLNSQDNVSQSILDLIRLHIGQQNDLISSSTPEWVEVLRKQMTNEFHGIRKLLSEIVVYAADPIRQDTVDQNLLQEKMEDKSLGDQDTEVNSVGLEAALTMMEWA